MSDIFDVNKTKLFQEQVVLSTKTEKELRDEIAKLKAKIYNINQTLNEHLTVVSRQRGEITKNVINQTKKTVDERCGNIVEQVRESNKLLDAKVQQVSDRLNNHFPTLDDRYLKVVNGGLTLVGPISRKNTKYVNGEREVTSLSIGENVITGVEIRDRLEEDRINVLDLKEKLELALYKLENVNGFVSSNNFRTSYPTPTQLSNFVITQLSTESNTLTEEHIPSGTKIKNTYDNHIWIFNNITVDGLTTMKWEDLGSDTICTASNDGVKGLVTGSEDKFRGYIDLKGVISINGLEEELTNILSSLSTVIANLQDYLKQVTSRLDSIEKRLLKLEN